MIFIYGNKIIFRIHGIVIILLHSFPKFACVFYVAKFNNIYRMHVKLLEIYVCLM